MVKTGDYNVLYTNTEIERSVKSIASHINDYHRANPKPSAWVCVLSGGFRFFSDITRYLAFDGTVDFCKVRTYLGTNKIGKTDIQRFKEISGSEIELAKGQRIYIFDDILDSGETAIQLAKYYNDRFEPSELVLCTVARRKTSPLAEVEKYYSKIISIFEIEDEWLIGYGMDNPDGFMRQIPSILKYKK